MRWLPTRCLSALAPEDSAPFDLRAIIEGDRGRRSMRPDLRSTVDSWIIAHPEMQTLDQRRTCVAVAVRNGKVGRGNLSKGFRFPPRLPAQRWPHWTLRRYGQRRLAYRDSPAAAASPLLPVPLAPPPPRAHAQQSKAVVRRPAPAPTCDHHPLRAPCCCLTSRTGSRISTGRTKRRTPWRAILRIEARLPAIESPHALASATRTSGSMPFRLLR